jgi:hypothetical protein
MEEEVEMKKIFCIPLMILTVSHFAGYCLLAHADNVMKVHVQTDGFSKLSNYSPRQYCNATGGRVSETSQQHIYLCCYMKKNKCIVANIKDTVSWLFPYHTPKQINMLVIKKYFAKNKN